MDGSTPPTDTTAAVIVATLGRFRIVRFLGRGGMGEVYLADDPLLDRPVALKVLAPDVADDPERRAFFQREATSAAALNHPNICTIFEVGEADGRPYIAMEAIEGRTLSDRLKHSPLSIDETVAVALQIASALEQAQERHVVHRDLKSANIMITSKGAVKVLDFGLAKRVASKPGVEARTTRWVSNREIVFGTLPYMSPEQALGRSVDHRSDLFSLGTILYEALTRKMPFDGPTTSEVLNAVVNSEPPAIDRENPQVPPGLALVVAKLLAKDPAARYQSASDVIRDLRAIQETGRLARPRLVVSRRHMLIATAIAVAILATVSTAAWWRTHRITVAGVGTVQSLVVVPATVTGPPQFQFLADAIPNSLTTRLAEQGGIRLKVPPTAIEFGNVGGNLVRVIDSYGVSVCVVPKATVTSGRLTVNVQLVEPRSRDILWSGEFASPIERYAEAVAQAADGVSLALTGRRPSAPAASASSTASTLELAVSRGDYHARNFNAKYQQTDRDLAQAAYREALQIDPRTAAAAAGLAYLEIFAMQGGESPERALPAVDLWGRRAVEFDPQNPQGWAALANGERWRARADLPKLLDYGFHAASLGEACGRCQLALMLGVGQFSQVLKLHIAQHDSELDPLSAYGNLNSAVALTALGRADEASAAIGRAGVIEPDALWVPVHRTFMEAASGSMRAAAADAEALVAHDRMKTMPPFVARILDLIRADAKGDRREISRVVLRLREPAHEGRATLIEVQYLTAVAIPMLARAGQADAALGILADLTAADSPPPYDMVVMNPFLKRLMEDARAREIVARSQARFDLLLKAIEEARSGGRFPRYLEQPLQDLMLSLRDSGRTR